MDDNKQLQELEQEQSQVINIEYDRPKFIRRILANFIDILLFVFVFVVCFIGVRSIVTSSSDYIDNFTKIQKANIASSLYVNVNDVDDERGYRYGDEVSLLTSYLPNQNTLTYNDIVLRCEKAINKFFVYLDEIDHSAYLSAAETYDTARLEVVGDNKECPHYFYRDSETSEIKKCMSSSDKYYYSMKSYFDNFYRLFIDNTLVDDYFATYTPNYRENLKTVGKYLLYVELPISYVSACVVVYFIPPLIFRRGKKTFGKLLYHIGAADKHVFSLSFPRFLARFAIFFFAEMILSVFTFGAPFIISFSFMVFTKNKQSFPDYVLGINEVDTSTQKLYYNKYEALIDKAKNYKKAPDFKLPKKIG